VIAVALLLAGCGGSSRSAETESETEVSGQSCAAIANAAELPARFPKSLPLPRGTRFTSIEDDGKTITAAARVPGTIRGIAQFFLDRLPKAGYEVGEGDSEEHEVESHFTGHGSDGFFKVNTIGGCPGKLTLALVLTGS
jgi:hypothetical protein